MVAVVGGGDEDSATGLSIQKSFPKLQLGQERLASRSGKCKEFVGFLKPLEWNKHSVWRRVTVS